MSYNTRSNTSSWRARKEEQARLQLEESHRKQTEKTENNFPTLVATAHRIRIPPQGFAEKAEKWRVQEELQNQLEAYRKAKTARERRMIMNTVFVFQRRNTDSADDEDEDYEEEWEDVEVADLYPPHGRRGTYTAADEEGWRLVTRLPFRPPHGEMTEEQLHQMYLDRGNQNDEDEHDVNGDLTDRNQRREFY